MRRRITFVTLATLGMVVMAGASLRAQEVPSDYQQVLTILDKKGDYKANVFKLNIPRNDLNVTVGGVATPTPFGFGGWIAMTKGDKGMDVMMGDHVLLEDKVNPIMSALLENGLEMIALHNHFFWATPRIFYMRVHGYGKPTELARKVKPAIELIGKIAPRTSAIGRSPANMAPIVPGKLDTAGLDGTIDHPGEHNGPIYKFTIGRDDLELKEMGATINSRMGLNTGAAFFGTDAKAVVAGGVAMLENEITSVLRALRAHGLDVVAIHHHMTGSRPMIIFLHYWGKGPATKLVAGFKAALNELGKRSHYVKGGLA